MHVRTLALAVTVAICPAIADSHADFLRTWLVCGDFPNPPHSGQSEVDHTPPCVGLETDYLGGEAAIRPQVGRTHPRPDETTATWTRHEQNTDFLDFAAVLGKRPTDNKVAYAYTTVEVDEGGSAMLAIGSDDGIRVYLNGEQVHENLVGRAAAKDADLIPVTLLEGTNHLLCKVENGTGGWGLFARVVDKAEAEAIAARLALQKNLLAFQGQEIVPAREWEFILTPGQFPTLDWEDPDRVEELMGPLPLKVRWFNADLEECTKPTKPGRYMATLEGSTTNGIPVRRALTFYCRPESWHPWQGRALIPVPHPKASGIGADVWEEQGEAIAAYTGEVFLNSLFTKERGAILLAHLQESTVKGRPPLQSETAEIAHDDAQLALRLRLQGSDSSPHPLQPPRPRSTPAPTLRAGTEQAAGFKPGTTQALRKICQAWYAESNEPFVTLVARHGIVILHEGFGDSNQLPQGLETPMWMASITKAITGMLFAQFVDQGRIGIDDPVGDYLPDFPTTGEQTLTLRHCFTHTTGLDGHMEWGGMHNPWLDNVILNGLGYLTPGQTHHYNGMGYDLAGKVMEVSSGKSIFRLFYEHFFEPLGAHDTTMDDVATATLSTAEDIARIGQVLLNGGSYGDLEFFSPETFDQLLPKPLNSFYPEIADIEWGIGLTWMRQPVPDSTNTYLSANTIGHGAASSAVLRVDLDNRVVISQTRNDAGKNYGGHLNRFIQTIHQSLLDESTD